MAIHSHRLLVTGHAHIESCTVVVAQFVDYSTALTGCSAFYGTESACDKTGIGAGELWIGQCLQLGLLQGYDPWGKGLEVWMDRDISLLGGRIPVRGWGGYWVCVRHFRAGSGSLCGE